jgi:hypothetical protein
MKNDYILGRKGSCEVESFKEGLFLRRNSSNEMITLT